MSLAELTDPAARVVLFPVRHHSPACARLVVDLIEQARPAAVLIEGPSDFNDRIDELLLPHELPVAIYSYVRLPDGRRRGAFYPFCVYSPEWQALHTAGKLGAAVHFIDLPWADVAGDETPAHRYADAQLGRGPYIDTLCRKLGVDDFDALWDTLVELDGTLSIEEYLRRAHHFCYHVRLLDERVDETDRAREAFMAAEIRQALEAHEGPVLVVTGGYHSYALHARLAGESFVGTDEPVQCEPSPPADDEERGIALTPYSYERLDSLTGYDSGMPNPGFYDRVWHDRRAGRPLTLRHLLTSVVRALRKRGQPVSTADLIAVRSAAHALASLRGHEEVWRSDLIDAVTAALVKEELEYGYGHPFLEAVYQVFRGAKRGRLAEGTPAPPLVRDIQRLLDEHDLKPAMRAAEHQLDLTDPPQRARSQILHRLRILQVSGFRRTGGTDLVARDDLAEIVETWEVRWSPEFDAGCVEAARYGPTLSEAATEAVEGAVEEAVERAPESAEAAATIEGLELAPWPEVDHAKHGPVERVELSRIKQISGPNLARNWVFIPHVTHQDEADITRLEAFRKEINAEQDVKVTMVALLLKACVPVLKLYPEFNSSLDGDGRHFEPMDDWSNRVDEQALQGELRRVLQQAIDGLPADYRTALVLHDVEGLSNPDIAEALNISLPAVKSRVHRSRLFVRKQLADYLKTA